jgi:lysophospholipid acyltransferase (LPLAT)-like uncharacterized protein
MKLRHPTLIKLFAFLAAWLVRWWIGTLRYRYRSFGPEIRPTAPGLRGRYIYAFWHESLLLVAGHYARRDVYVLISHHADGQLIAEVCHHLGFSLIRGSTTRGGVEAVRQMLRAGRKAHLAVTPDGPRGPRRRVQPGLVYLAARTGLPIVAAGIAYRRPWRLRSWDRFAVPKPWSTGICLTLAPITVPTNADNDQIEDYRQRLEEAMLWATDLAERWVENSGQGSEIRVRDRTQVRTERQEILR